MFWLLKRLIAACFLAVLAAVAFAAWKVDLAARDAASRALTSRGVRWESLSVRPFPPRVIATGLHAGALTAERAVLPLRLVTRDAGIPSFDGWTARVALPPAPSEIAALRALGDFDAAAGTLQIGDRAVAVRSLSRRGDAVDVDAAAGNFHGRLGEAGLSGALHVHGLAAPSLAGWLAPPPARVRGGTLSFEGKATLGGAELTLDGTLRGDDLLVEGSGTPSALERALQVRGNPLTIPLVLHAPLRADLGDAFRAAVARASS